MKILRQFSIHTLYALILLVTVFHFSATAQTYNAGNAYISGNVYMKSSFTNAATATYQNDGSLYITGNFNNNQAAMAEGAGATQFIGSIQQSLNGNQSPVFHDVLINNSNGLQMNINAAMGGIISPVAGSLYFNGYALTMGGQVNTIYTNLNAFNVTATSDLNITGNAAAGNGLYFDPAANTIHNVTVSSGATGTLGNALNITSGIAFGTVTVDGNFNAAGLLTLKSDSAGTARVGQSAGTITNNLTVERYIPPRRAWRFFCAPVNNDTLHIRSAWQEGATNPSLYVRYNPHPGYGTHITGDNNTSLGYDYNTTYNASILTWIQSTNKWSITAPPTISTLVNTYDAYCFFIRGSRAVDLAQATSAIADPTIIRTTGKANNNNWSKTFTGTIKNDMLFVPNPFASSVDIISLISTTNGIYKNKFWIWDPALAGDYGVGGYIAYSNGVMAPLTPNYPAPTTIIQANQAFFIQTNSNDATLKFKQTDKTASESKIFSRQMLTPYPAIYANLVVPQGSNFVLADGVGAAFGNNFSKEVDGEDAIKLWNFKENIALVRKQSTLAIELRPQPALTDTLFLRMYLKQQPYALEFFTRNFDMQNMRAWLVDKYLNTKTEVKLTDTTIYNFSPNPDTNSYRNRFMLVFNRQLSTTPVPVAKTINQQDPNTTGVANSAASTSGSINITPNPVRTVKNAMLRFSKMAKGNYEVIVYDVKGQQLITQHIQHDGNNKAYHLSANAQWPDGLYSVSIRNETTAEMFNLKLMISK